MSNNWISLGMLAGTGLAYGIGKSLLPEASFLIAACIMFGATVFGAILGKIASR